MRPIIIMLTVIMIAAVQAENYDKWILAGTNISFDGQTFITKVNQRWDILTVDQDSHFYMIGKTECEASPYYRICYPESRFNLSAHQGIHIVETETSIPEIHLTIAPLTPQVTLTIAADKTQMQLGETAKITVTVENKGQNRIHQVVYASLLPPQFELVDTTVTKKLNSVVWEKPSITDISTFTYTIKLVKPINTTIQAQLGYEYESQVTSKKSNELKIKVVSPPNPLKSTTKISPAAPKLGDKITYQLTIENTGSREAVVDQIKILIPKALTVVSAQSPLEKTGNLITWSGSVMQNEIKTFSFSFRIANSGKYNLTTETASNSYNEYQDAYLRHVLTLKDALEIKIGKVNPAVELNATSLSYNQSYSVRPSITNQDKDNPFFNVSCTLTSGLFGKLAFEVPAINPEKTYKFSQILFRAPSADKDTKFQIDFNCKYRTQYYQFLESKATASLTVKKHIQPTATPQEIPVAKQVPNTTVTTPAEPPQQKPNILKAFVDGLVSFFKRIFG
ncbi:MAG: hypothetical protein ABIG95_05410 [Candidatus Woesearchaeota archaeon]